MDGPADALSVSAEPTAAVTPAGRLGEGGLFWRILRAHWDMKGATQAMLATRPGEERLVALILLASGVYFAGRVAALALTGTPELSGHVGAEFVSGVLLRTLVFYAMAGLTGLVARAFKGEASWRETRVAVFWAAVASAPVVAAATIASALLAGRDELALAVEMAGQGFFGYAFCVAVALANRFRTAWGVFGLTAVILAALVGGLWLLLGGAV